jgi:hypothetical protein
LPLEPPALSRAPALCYPPPAPQIALHFAARASTPRSPLSVAIMEGSRVPWKSPPTNRHVSPTSRAPTAPSIHGSRASLLDLSRPTNRAMSAANRPPATPLPPPSIHGSRAPAGCAPFRRQSIHAPALLSRSPSWKVRVFHENRRPQIIAFRPPAAPLPPLPSMAAAPSLLDLSPPTNRAVGRLPVLRSATEAPQRRGVSCGSSSSEGSTATARELFGSIVFPTLGFVNILSRTLQLDL